MPGNGFADDARDEVSAYPCPDVMWQGIFEQVAEMTGLRNWGVWAAVYSGLGALAHKNLHLFFYRPLHGMVYTLVVAPTATGKGQYADIVEGILPPNYSIATGVQSGEGLLEVLCDVAPAVEKNEHPTYTPVPSLLLLPEFTALLKSARIDKSRLPESLNVIFQSEKPYTIARSNRLITGGKIVVSGPMLSIFATTTERQWTSTLSMMPEFISSGLFNRFLVLPGQYTRWNDYEGERAGSDLSQLSALTAHLVAHAWHSQRTPHGLWDLYEPDAFALRRSFSEEIEALMNEDSTRRDCLARLHFYSHHIAALYAWCQQRTTIALEHVTAALEAVRTAWSFTDHILSSPVQLDQPAYQALDRSHEARILEFIFQHPGSTARDVYRALARHVGPEKTNAILKAFVAMKSLEQRRSGNSFAFFPISH